MHKPNLDGFWQDAIKKGVILSAVLDVADASSGSVCLRFLRRRVPAGLLMACLKTAMNLGPNQKERDFPNICLAI
ncbi:MAG: hypothetical protein ACPG32_07435 [Akkermansiaceae bacterium]